MSEVTPDDALAKRTADLAGRIARHPVAALRMHKRLLRDAEQHSLATHLDVVAAFQAIAHASDEHLRAVRDVVGTLRQSR